MIGTVTGKGAGAAGQVKKTLPFSMRGSVPKSHVIEVLVRPVIAGF